MEKQRLRAQGQYSYQDPKLGLPNFEVLVSHFAYNLWKFKAGKSVLRIIFEHLSFEILQIGLNKNARAANEKKLRKSFKLKWFPIAIRCFLCAFYYINNLFLGNTHHKYVFKRLKKTIGSSKSFVAIYGHFRCNSTV